MSSHILAEVSRLADRIGIIHEGRLLRELSIADLEKERRRWLRLRVRDVQAAQRVLAAAGQPAESLADGALALKTPTAVEQPDQLNLLLAQAGTPPSELLVMEEDLERYFLRLIDKNGSVSHE
jgi:ABC-2 type transport system ATP-binding protein